MMLGRVAYLGSFSLRSAVTTAGKVMRICSSPTSTSLVILRWAPSFSSMEVKVAWDAVEKKPNKKQTNMFLGETVNSSWEILAGSYICDATRMQFLFRILKFCCWNSKYGGQNFPRKCPTFLSSDITCGHSNKAASIWPVWLQSSSMAWRKEQILPLSSSTATCKSIGQHHNIVTQLHLFPQYHEVSLLLFCELGQDFCYGQGLQISRILSCHLNVNSPVCTHCQSSAKYLLSAHEYTGRYDDGVNTTK